MTPYCLALNPKPLSGKPTCKFRALPLAARRAWHQGAVAAVKKAMLQEMTVRWVF